MNILYKLKSLLCYAFSNRLLGLMCSQKSPQKSTHALKLKCTDHDTPTWNKQRTCVVDSSRQRCCISLDVLYFVRDVVLSAILSQTINFIVNITYGCSDRRSSPSHHTKNYFCSEGIPASASDHRKDGISSCHHLQSRFHSSP